MLQINSSMNLVGDGPTTPMPTKKDRIAAISKKHEGKDLTDQQKKILKSTDRRDYEYPDDEATKIEKHVFKDVHDVENTHSSYTRKVDNGFVDSEKEPQEDIQVKFDSDEYDRSDNLYDKEFIQTDATNQSKLSLYIKWIESPEELDETAGSLYNLGQREIYDEDGDGIQDLAWKLPNYHELDKFYMPRVYGVVEDLHNTHWGGLPGHPEKSFDDT